MSKMESIISKIIKPSDVCLDIGGGVGSIAKLLLTKAKWVDVVEPDKDNIKLIIEKLNNGKTNYELHKIGLSNQNRSRNLYKNPANILDNRLFYVKEWNKYSIDVKRGSDYFKGKRFDFIKIDTQGHEMHVLEGLGNMLKYPDNMMIEFWPYGLDGNKKTVHDILDILKQYGFSYRIIWRGVVNQIIDNEDLTEIIGDIKVKNQHADIWASKNYF